MIYTTQMCVKPKSPFYEYFSGLSVVVNNLRNTALFLCRQAMTMVNKPFDRLTENELEAYHMIESNLPRMNENGNQYDMPSKGKQFLSYGFLNRFMVVSCNKDYYAENLPRQSAQATLKEVTKDMKGFYSACRAYKKDPSVFTGKPRPPKYGEQGGYHTITLTNQDCVIYPVKGQDDCREVKFPGNKARMFIRKTPIKGRLKQVTVTPSHDCFVLSFVFENEQEVPDLREPCNIIGIDLGVNNTAAITNNLGLPSLLFKGGVMKSVNQLYNKKMSKLQSNQTKGTIHDFVMTPEAHKLCAWRNNRIKDTVAKTGCYIVKWCEKNNIDTIVIGQNAFWKQSTKLGHKSNQNFAQLPLHKLIQNIQYRAERAGIRVITREESYTSKASFLDNDVIPEYGKTTDEPTFSGNRIKRGLYRASDGTIINADLNGSANILRKEYPAAFAVNQPDFQHVVIIKYPGIENAIESHQKQLAARTGAISKSKAKRLARKAKAKQK